MIAELLMVAGAMFTLLAAIGVIRFSDVLERAHALTKASILGLILVLLGAALAGTLGRATSDLVLIGALQLLTLPLATNLMSRAAYRAEGIANRIDAVDEYAERHPPPED